MIWGAPLPHTLEEIAEQERRLERLAAAIDEKARKEEEARAERDRKYQEDREQRAREKLAQAETHAAHARLSVPPDARSWDSPSAHDTDPPHVPTYSEWLAGANVGREGDEMRGAPTECVDRKPAQMQDFPDDPTHGLVISDSSNTSSVQPVTVPDMFVSSRRRYAPANASKPPARRFNGSQF